MTCKECETRQLEINDLKREVAALPKDSKGLVVALRAQIRELKKKNRGQAFMLAKYHGEQGTRRRTANR